MPRRRFDSGTRRPVHWWSEDIAALRVDCSKARRKYTRSAKRNGLLGSIVEREEFRSARKVLRNAIRASQRRSWANLCEEVNSDPWGIPYRIVTKRLSNRPLDLAAKGREREIADSLFPDRPSITWSDIPHVDGISPDPTPLTIEELREAIDHLPRGKAAGPDGVPNEILSVFGKKAPILLLDVFKKCISQSTFPTRWKRARLVLLHKGQNKPVTEPSSYRPLCMLDTAGKLLERIILQRLSKLIASTGSASPNQFGFMKGRSTEDAINKILDTAKWANSGPSQHQELCVLVALVV